MNGAMDVPKIFAMLDIQLNVFSRSLLGGVADPSMVQRKISLLSRLGLINSSTKSLTVDGIEGLVTVFRISLFSADDLTACREFSVAEVTEYQNPCNLRNALKRALDYCEKEKLNDLVDQLTAEMNRVFRGGYNPIPSSSTRADDSVFPSINTLTHAVTIIDGAHGHSLIAASKLSRGDTVISLPADAVISVLSSLRDPRFPGEDLFDQGLHPDIIFLLYLVFLRERTSLLDNLVHRDFFASQPESYGTLFEVPHAVLEAIDEPVLASSVKEQNEQLKTICKSLQPEPEFKDILWAKSLCTSRAFSLPLKPQSDVETRLIAEYYPSGFVTTLVPVVHFFNHDFAAQCELPVVDSDGSITVRTLVDVDEGSEIFINYGGFSNKEFMLNYGFFLQDNPYDSHITDDGKYFRRGAVRTPQVSREISSESDVPPLVKGYLMDRARFLNHVA